VRLIENPAVDPSRVAAPSDEARAFHEGLPGYAPTPLHDLGGGVRLKDESNRLGLPAFKVLGASWAIERTLRERPDVRTLVAASAGNHGRAVAHVAARRGLAARIFLPKRSSEDRRRAIASEGAEVVVVDGAYEEAVAASRAEGEREGVAEIADVGASGPAAWVIDGYATLFAEIAAQARAASSGDPAAGRGAAAPIDTLLVPIGVGSLGAAAARFGAQHGVRVVGVEPETAACLTASLAAGEPTVVETPGTSMAGLDCAEVSEAAWPDLLHGIHATVTVSDPEVHDAMRELAAAGLRIGDSGAAPYAALSALPERGRTVLVATEGPTDPAGYERVVGARP
jgi:diaminopropionate ammonia-lyase